MIDLIGQQFICNVRSESNRGNAKLVNAEEQTRTIAAVYADGWIRDCHGEPWPVKDVVGKLRSTMQPRI